MVVRRPQHAVSKLACLVLSSARACRSSILSRSSLRRLAGLPCRLFLLYGLQVVTREVHRSSLRQLICPSQDHFIFLALLIIYMTCVLSLTQMLVILPVCDVEHTSLHFGLQADRNVAFEDTPVFGVCRPSCHDSALYLFALVQLHTTKRS